MQRRVRRIVVVAVSLIGLAITVLAAAPPVIENVTSTTPSTDVMPPTGSAADALATLPVKGRAPKTGYARTQFGNGWSTVDGCDTRNIILHRDLKNTQLADDCKVVSGTLDDPYTGMVIMFSKEKSSLVQIDHVVALSDAWQSGAQNFTHEQRIMLANDPLELLAVQGDANQQKSDGDAATWLPSNKSFRCQYVARQIAVKQKYHLWVKQAEEQAMDDVLSACPGQTLPAQ